MYKRASLKKKKKVSAVAFLCVSTVFCPQSETGLRQLALNNWQASWLFSTLKRLGGWQLKSDLQFLEYFVGLVLKPVLNIQATWKLELQ